MAVFKPDQPVFFLASPNPYTRQGFLRQIDNELKAIMNVLEPAVQAGHVFLRFMPSAQEEDVSEVFQDAWYEGRIVIFHYSGHADEDDLFYYSEDGSPAQFNAEGLARFLGAQEGLELVFLNACATQDQAKGLMEAGIPAVIATSRKIGDTMAREFAEDFYRGIASGANVEQAFAEAEGIQLGNLGPMAFMKEDPTRGIFWETADEAEPLDFPWRLFLKETALNDSGNFRLFTEEKKAAEVGQVAPESFIGEVLNNTYEIKEFLGAGSLGSVFIARHTSLNEDRAIKITHRVLAGYDQLKTILLAGVKGLSSLQHPNVVRTYDAGEVNLFGEKRLFMVMEYVQGDRLDKIDFRSILYKKSQLKTFLDFTLELCGGFAAAHDTRYEDANRVSREGIVHGNIKTRKILFTPEGIPKIIDFMFTDLTRSPAIKLEIPLAVQEKMAAENPADYFAPEVLSGRSGVNKLTDIYGMGAVFFEVVSGRKLSTVKFRSEEELHKIIRDQVSFFPRELSEIIFKALQPNPQNRYLSTNHMKEDLLSYSTFTQKMWYRFFKNFLYRFRKK
jgi:serine/threonine protein kinase